MEKTVKLIKEGTILEVYATNEDTAVKLRNILFNKLTRSKDKKQKFK